MTRSKEASKALLCLHRLDRLKQLAGIGDFHERLCRILAAHNVDRRGVLNVDLAPDFFVGIDLSGKLALRIDYERQFDLVLGGEFLREVLQVVRHDLRLVLEDKIPKLIAEI